MERVVVHLWSELTSPRSLLGLLNLREAVVGRSIAVEHHAFISPTPQDDDDAVAELAARGLTLAGRHSPDTRHAQELIYAAKAAGSTPEEAAEHGMRAAMTLQEAALIDGTDITTIDSLIPIAEGLGLDPDTVRAGLSDGRWSESVEGDLADAGRLRLERAPHLLIAGMYALEGPSTAADMGRVFDLAAEQLGMRLRAAESEARELFGWGG